MVTRRPVIQEITITKAARMLSRTTGVVIVVTEVRITKYNKMRISRRITK